MEVLEDIKLALLTPTELVDDYVTVVAELRALETRRKELQDAMVDTGQTKLQGTINRVTIVSMPGQKTVQVKKMVKDGLLSQEIVDQYTTQGEGYKQYRISV